MCNYFLKSAMSLEYFFMKTSESPLLHKALIIGNDPYLAAQISSILSLKNHYLPVIDGPRLSRIDSEAEVTRRNNAAARQKPNAIFLVGLEEEAIAKFKSKFPKNKQFPVATIEDLKNGTHGLQLRTSGCLLWGKDKIGLGLLTALREKKEIQFGEIQNSSSCVAFPESDLLVVCEEGDALAQVIAANYAYSIGAGLCLVPKVNEDDSERILESFYSIYEPKEKSTSVALEELRDEIKALGKNIPDRRYDIITFISKPFPWGFAYHECPSSHLFIYPDLGISLINNLAAEQPDSRAMGIAAVIDPQDFPAPEVEVIANLLADRHMMVRGFRGTNANVNDVSKMLELLPYDFLLITTHCGDSKGWRWTYEYLDSEKIPRNLVVDIAIGVGQTPGEEKLEVKQYIKFISLDGVDWNDKDKKQKLYIGEAIKDFIEFTRMDDGMKPIKKENIDRVKGSSMLKMFDDNLLVFPVAFADNTTPIIFNNACCSWHGLSKTFIFGNTRAYVGTLFQVTNTEAEEIAMRLLKSYFGKPLALALWRAQNDVYPNSIRRPYLLVGTHFQKLRTTVQSNAQYLIKRLLTSEKYWARTLQDFQGDNESNKKTIESNLKYIRQEIDGLKKHMEQRHLKTKIISI